MGIFPYPRIGQRLAPSLLREVLDVSVLRVCPSAARIDPELRLCDLDETVWQRFDLSQCQALAKAVVQRVQVEIKFLGPRLSEQSLPKPRGNIRLEDLELGRRAYNCLRRLVRREHLQSAEDWHRLTLKKLLGIRAFGAKAVVDFLVAYEALLDPFKHGKSMVQDALRRQEEARRLEEQAMHNWLRNPTETDLPRIQSLHVPPIPKGTKLADLQLQNRTWNCLKRQGYDDDLGALEGQRIGDLLGIWGFGSNCLHDLLAALYRPLAAQPLPQTVEEELRGLLGRVRPNRRDVNAIMRRFGFDGKGGATLANIGHRLGISREAVRQICAKVRHTIRRKTVLLPLLDEAVKLVSARVPGRAEDIEAGLLSAGLTKARFRLEGLCQAAAFLGRPVSFRIDSSLGTRLIVSASTSSPLARVLGEARLEINHWGVATPAQVAANLAKKTSQPWDPQFVREILASRDDCTWLDRKGGWFWFPDVGGNHLLDGIRKVLAVAGSIDLCELHRAIARSFHRADMMPPPEVLLELCRGLPGLRVKDLAIIADPPIPWPGTVPNTDAAIARILLDHGSAMRIAELRKICSARRIDLRTLDAKLNNSAVIKKIAPRIYGLWGVEPQAGVLESLGCSTKTAASWQ